MIAHAIQRRANTGYMRPFVPHRDLGSLATLIERAFETEITDTGSTIVRDLRQMAMLGPLLRATGAIVTPFTGFVWIEGDQVVGNVSLTVERGLDRTWTMSNVAVLPEYRQRGIASRLIDRSIEHVRAQGGKKIHLQVSVRNDVATHMYEQRAFCQVDTLHELTLNRYAWPVLVGRRETPVRRARLLDTPSIRKLLRDYGPQGPPPLQVLRGRRTIALGLGQAIRYLLTGERAFQAVVTTDHRVGAYGCARACSGRGPHELALFALPGHRGEYEVPILEWLLARLSTCETYSVRTVISGDHPEAVAAANEVGFVTTRVLTQMILDLSSDQTEFSH